MKVCIAESPQYTPNGVCAMRDAGWDVVFYAGSLATLPSQLYDVDGLIVRFGRRWDAEALQQAAPLHFLGVPATGTDHVDREAAAALGIAVISLAGHPGLQEITATPEHAFGLMLSLLRGTVPAHASVLRGVWDRNAFFGHQVKGLNVGIVGLGRTGQAFAAMAVAFGARVHYYDPYVSNPLYTRCESLAVLASHCRVVAVHAVLNEETAGLLGAPFFAAMQPGAYLVNTARGALLDEDALLDALQSGQLAGAALDVLCGEPGEGASLASKLLAYARRHTNLILTPHIAGATAESIEQAEYLLVQLLLESFSRDLYEN